MTEGSRELFRLSMWTETHLRESVPVSQNDLETSWIFVWCTRRVGDFAGFGYYSLSNPFLPHSTFCSSLRKIRVGTDSVHSRVLLDLGKVNTNWSKQNVLWEGKTFPLRFEKSRRSSCTIMELRFPHLVSLDFIETKATLMTLERDDCVYP